MRKMTVICNVMPPNKREGIHYEGICCGYARHFDNFTMTTSLSPVKTDIINKSPGKCIYLICICIHKNVHNL